MIVLLLSVVLAALSFACGVRYAQFRQMRRDLRTWEVRGYRR